MHIITRLHLFIHKNFLLLYLYCIFLYNIIGDGMKKEKQQFEETGVFLDAMSKRERKKWEKEQAKLKLEQALNVKDNKKEAKEISSESDLKDEEIIKQQDFKEEDRLESELEETEKVNDEEVEPIGVTISSEELEQELEKTREIMSITQELPTKIKTRSQKYDLLDEEDNDLVKNSFNPVPLIGFSLFIAIAGFIYLVLFSNYDNDLFLYINAGIVVLFTLFFSLTTLSNQKNVKIFAIFDLLIILALVIFDGVSIVNYDNIYNKVEIKNESKNDNTIKNESKPESEEKIINEYNCINSDNTITILITEENNYITYLEKSEIIEDKDILNKLKEIYENKAGISSTINSNQLITKFEFTKLDFETYQEVIEKHNGYYRLDSQFDYIENGKINYTKYVNSELGNFTCTKK